MASIAGKKKYKCFYKVQQGNWNSEDLSKFGKNTVVGSS